jgi:hypothetical protein
VGGGRDVAAVIAPEALVIERISKCGAGAATLSKYEA